MSFFNTLKELASVVIEAAKENPVAATGIAVGTVAVIGGGIAAKKHFDNKKVAAAKAVAAQPAVEEPTLLNGEMMQPEVVMATAKSGIL